jgi:predicted PurR-regulated permease PerM
MDIRRRYASVLILALTAFLVYALIPYINAFFGAIILYSIFKPVYVKLTDRWKADRTIAAVAVIVFSIILITIPFLYAMGLLFKEVQTISTTINGLSRWLDDANTLIPGINLGDIVREQLVNLGKSIQGQMIQMVYGFTHTLVNLTIMYFVLYYMLVGYHELPRFANSISPFNEKNTRRLAQEVSSVTHSTLLSQVLVGVLHGLLLAVGFSFFGFSDPVFWGFVATILSMLPVFGTPLIWVPAGIIRISGGDMFSGVGILVWGAFLTNVDSLLRPLIQFRVSKMHPLVSIIGFFIGVTYFGILGIVVGPLLLSYFFLMFEMFKEEYLSHDEHHGDGGAHHTG